MPSPERALLVRAFFTLVSARVTTWVLPFRVARRMVVARARHSGGATHQQVRWAIDVAQKFVPGATCLPQAIAAESLLMRAGHHAQLHLGVRKKPDGRLDAHAWVECDGRVVVGDLPQGLSEYTRLPPLPALWSDSDTARVH